MPLSRPEFARGYGIDTLTTMITFVEVSALTAAVELIVTIFDVRASMAGPNFGTVCLWREQSRGPVVQRASRTGSSTTSVLPRSG
ncbi:hypothetical protein [Rhodobacter sp. NSM]|uniref:hypothetical protein n=1 Tax=Rhodobacter sp. NSM TaxID=3457501 RepID=UPI003FD060AD